MTHRATFRRGLPREGYLLTAKVEGAEDLREFMQRIRSLPPPQRRAELRRVLEEVARGNVVPSDLRLARVLLDVPVPTIAAMEGHAIGGGLALGLCADVTLIARERMVAKIHSTSAVTTWPGCSSETSVLQNDGAAGATASREEITAPEG